MRGLRGWVGGLGVAVEEVEEGDGGAGEGFGGGDGEPEPGDADDAGEEDEGGDEEDDAAQEGVEGGGSGSLDALVVAYEGDVDGEKRGAGGEVGESVDGKGVGWRAALQEETDYGVSTDDEQSSNQDAADHGCLQGYTQCLPHSCRLTRSVVVADDGLS